MSPRYASLHFVKNEFMKNLKNPIFIGFLGVFFLIITFILIQPIENMSTPASQMSQEIFLTSGLILGVLFAYLTATSFAKEYEKRTMNILVTTPLSRDAIFYGKIFSIFLLIPIILLLIGIGVLMIWIINGYILNLELELIFFRMALLAFFLISIVTFTLVIALIVKRSAASITTVIFYIYLTIPLGLEFGYYRTENEMILRYEGLFMFPSSLYNLGIDTVLRTISVDWTLLLCQILYSLIFMLIGVIIFRRAELWG